MKYFTAANVCAISLLLGVTAGVAQGVFHATPAFHPGQPATQTADTSTRARGVNEATQHTRVLVWFSNYDNIRHAAQMAPAEKTQAHQLIMTAIAGSSSDKQAAKQKLARMASRYATAIHDLTLLHPIPETAPLQKEYLKYFKIGNQFFQSFQNTIVKNDAPKSLAELQAGRRVLSTQDITCKTLDKKLRKQYAIERYPWD